MLLQSGLDPAEWRDFEFREGAGCIECGGTGYRGRTAIHELLDLTDPIRELILDKKPTSEVRKLAQQGRHELSCASRLSTVCGADLPRSKKSTRLHSSRHRASG
jgi:type II secretory ATPase GspE/PulE/Tfp pilus assembly ATPase PilB-like protein